MRDDTKCQGCFVSWWYTSMLALAHIIVKSLNVIAKNTTAMTHLHSGK